MQWKQETGNPSKRLKKNTGIALWWLQTLARGWAHQCLLKSWSVSVSSSTVLPASMEEGRTVRRFVWGVVRLRCSPETNAPRADTHTYTPPEARQKASLTLPPVTPLGSLVVPTFRGCTSAGQGSSVWC
jgi:hypothetical protein